MSKTRQDILKQIRRAVREKRYQMTDHALEEADADDLTLEDVCDVLLNGTLEAIYTHDTRGARYIVRGRINKNEVDVVCRFHKDHVLLIIITVYVID